jgi:sigma-B regulation protein RsbU (phosphoserine phosphatase)
VPYDTCELYLKKGDTLFFYTDGFTEAMDGDMNPYGEERLMACLEGQKGSSLQEVAKEVLADIRDHVGGAEQYDDMTFLFLRVD